VKEIERIDASLSVSGKLLLGFCPRCREEFLRATAAPAGTVVARIAMAILSVRLSVCLSVTTRWRSKPRWDRDSGSSPYDSLEYL